MKIAYYSAFLCIMPVASNAYKLNKIVWYSSPGGAPAPPLRPSPGYAYAYNVRTCSFRWSVGG